MADLRTKYMGLELKNPIIIGSSSLTAGMDSLKRAEDSGAGAVVLKSIFEEEITDSVAKDMKMAEDYLTVGDAHLLLSQASKNNCIQEYLNFVRKAKESLDIPVIASINCTDNASWLDYIRLFSECKADAVELNCYKVAGNADEPAVEIEKHYVEIAKKAKKNLGAMPVSMKLSWYFTSVSNIAKRLAEEKTDGLVFFNYFYHPDIDVEKVLINSEHAVQPKGDYSETLRWTALLSSQIKTDICSSKGIRSWDTVAKMLLAGAKAVQMTSAVYEKGWDVVGETLKGLEDWMDRHSFKSVDSFCGILSRGRIKNPAQWERAQFMKLYKD